MNPETKFSRWLCNGPLKQAHVQRLEVTSGSGVPDINACFEGHEIWIETKITIRGSTYLRPYQHAWIRRRVTAKGKIFIASFDEESDQVAIWLGRHVTNVVPVGDKLRIMCPYTVIYKRNQLTIESFIRANDAFI